MFNNIINIYVFICFILALELDFTGFYIIIFYSLQKQHKSNNVLSQNNAFWSNIDYFKIMDCEYQKFYIKLVYRCKSKKGEFHA